MLQQNQQSFFFFFLNPENFLNLIRYVMNNFYFVSEVLHSPSWELNSSTKLVMAAPSRWNQYDMEEEIQNTKHASIFI